MGYSNGQVQSSSDSGKAQKGDPGLPGIGFNLTDDGNSDLDGKRLTDVADPVDNGDAVTKGYVDTKNSRQNIAIYSKAEKAYVDSENSTQDIAINSKADKNKVLLLDGSQSMNANLNMDNQKITNIANATDNDDAVNFSQLKSHTDSHLNNYHLQPSFTFYRNFGNQGKLPRSTRINLFPNHHHHGLNWVKKEGSDSGFNGQTWVSLKMTNNLPVGIYTVVFELFSGISGISGTVTQLNNETLITQVHGDANYKIITFSHDYQTTHSKAFIQFHSNGQPGEITFQIRYYGSSYNNSTLNFLFFSRVILGKIGTYFDHALLDVDDVQYKNQILYFEDVNLNDNKLKGLAAPSEDKDGANKKYVDDQINAIPNVDTSDLLKLDGSRAMRGDLNMYNEKITELETQDDVPITDYPNYVKDAKMAVNKGYVNEHFLKLDSNNNYFDLKQKVIKNTEPFYDGLFGDNDLVSKAFVDAEITKLPKAPSTSDLLKLDGTRAMTGNLQMGDHTITGIRSSSADNAALTVGASKSLYLPITGIRGMQGNLNMSGQSIINLNKIKGLAEPTDLKDGANKKYVDDQIKAIPAVDTSDLLKLDGSRAMTGNLQMRDNFITNVKDPQPSNSHYGATVNFVNKTVSDNNTTISALINSKIDQVEDLNIKAAKQENVFSFIMNDDLFKEDDSDITKVGKVNKDFYDIHKETYQFNINYDSSIGYYSTRLGIDLKPLDLGEYTFVFEMYYDKNKVNKYLVVVEAQSVPLNISKNTTKTFDNHSRTIINFNKPGNLNIIDLDIDITMKNKASIAYDPTTTIFVVVYGVSGHQNDVESRVFDRVYLIQNNTVLFEATIDMKNKQIKNLADGAADGDAVNVSQLINMIATENTEIDKIKTDVTNNYDLLLALYNYIMKNGTKVGIIKDLYFTDSQESRTTNTYLFNFSTHLDNNIKTNFTFYYVFRHNTGTNNVMRIAFRRNSRVGLNPFHCYIHVSKSQIKISLDPLINDPHISLINIPNNALGKINWLWIWTQGNSFHLITSGTNVIVLHFHEVVQTGNWEFNRVNVDDSPFPKTHGLITSNVYDNNSEAYRKAREFERAQGTII